MRLRPPSLALLGAGLLSSIRPVLSESKPPVMLRVDNYPFNNGQNLTFNQNRLFGTQLSYELKFDFELTCDQPCSTSYAILYNPASSKILYNASGTPPQEQDGPPAAKLFLDRQPPPISPGKYAASGSIRLVNADKFGASQYDQLPKFRLQIVWSVGKNDVQGQNIQNPTERDSRYQVTVESPYFRVADPSLSSNSTYFSELQSRFQAEPLPPLGGGDVPQNPGNPATTADNPPQATNTGSSGNTGQAPGNGMMAGVSGEARGLSTGAIAGIAVGAALGALLLGTIVAWLCLRHRRQSKAGKPGLAYGSGPGRSGDIVAEKEANTMVAESPRSPYSEDGHRRESTLIGSGSAASSGAAGLMAAHRNERDRDAAGDYVPYSDHPTSSSPIVAHAVSSPVARAGSSNSRSTIDRSSAAFPASAVPPPVIGEEGIPPRADTGMSGRYAHLVEDGMTREEIARLEEEEHQLDVAIEQARGVTTK